MSRSPHRVRAAQPLINPHGSCTTSSTPVCGLLQATVAKNNTLHHSSWETNNTHLIYQPLVDKLHCQLLSDRACGTSDNQVTRTSP